MKKLLVFLFFSLPLVSISQNFEWAVSCAKGHDNDFGVISTNTAGDIFLTGSFSYPMGIFGNDTLDAGGEYLWVMLSKLNSKGEFQWTRGIKIQGEHCSSTETFAFASNYSDDVYFMGNVCGDVYFVDSVHFVSSVTQMFLSKYDKDGNCTWAIEPGNNIRCGISRVFMDSTDHIIMMGFAGGTISFNGHVVSPGRFLARFSPEGVCDWIKNINLYEQVVFQEFCCLHDGGYLLAGKTTAKTVIIETDTLTSSTIYGGDLLLVKYDSNGKYLWSKLDGQTGAVNWATQVKSDHSGNFYVTGSQSGDTLIFGSHVLPNKGSVKMFLVKYDSTGTARWAVNTQGSCETDPGGLFINDNKRVYVTGGILVTAPDRIVIFDSFSITIKNYVGMFVSCYDSTGICIGVRYAESNGASGTIPFFCGYSVETDEGGNFVVAGQFERDAYFDETTLTSMGKKDIFIAKSNPITGVEELKTTPQNQLLIYANPNTGKCNITIPEEFANEKDLVLQIFDLQGKLFQQSRIEISDGKIRLDIQAQAKGMYTAILSNGKRSYTGKIVFE